LTWLRYLEHDVPGDQRRSFARHGRGAGRAERGQRPHTKGKGPTETVTVRKARLSVCAVLLLLVQVCAAYRLSYGILRVDLLYLLAGFLALEAAPANALWSALAIGVLRDLASSARLSASALATVLATAALLAVRDRLYREPVFVDMALLFVYALLAGVVEATAVAIADRADWSVLLGCALGQAAFTAALVPVFFFLFERVGLLERKDS
jgi:rod shape-determining protein MreD